MGRNVLSGAICREAKSCSTSGTRGTRRRMAQLPLARCTACGAPPLDLSRPLRRGRCERCYETWVRARPIGVGACCAVCDNRRKVHLRHYEVGWRSNTPGGRWLILCHNCAAAAEKLDPPPRSVDGLKMRLSRDRRWGDRRAESVGRGPGRAPGLERRSGDRRDPYRGLLDATELVIEIEADYAEISEDRLADIADVTEEITGIHFKIDP